MRVRAPLGTLECLGGLEVGAEPTVKGVALVSAHCPGVCLFTTWEGGVCGPAGPYKWMEGGSSLASCLNETS